jgi:predicted dehydrogenase
MAERFLRLRKREPEPQGSPITLAVIGLGVSGTNQLRALDGLRETNDERLQQGKRLQLVVVCDMRPKLVPGVRFTTDYQEILGDSGIQAVSIVTPPESHMRIAMEALAAGKHVYDEKPPALRVEDCNTMIASAREQDKKLFFSYHYRYHPLMLAATEALRGRDIRGIDITINQDAFVHHDPNGWTFNPNIGGGGTLIDDGINFLGVVPQILGHSPKFAITDARFAFDRGMQVETRADVDFRFGQNGNGKIKLDWLNGEQPERKIVFLADDARYTVDLMKNVFHSDDIVYMDLRERRGDRDKIMEYEGAYADFAAQIVSGVSTSELSTSTWALDVVNQSYRHAGLQYPHL